MFPALLAGFLAGIIERAGPGLVLGWAVQIWFQGGIDDPLVPQSKHWFLGGMLRFTDDDLKTLMTVAPSP